MSLVVNSLINIFIFTMGLFIGYCLNKQAVKKTVNQITEPIKRKLRQRKGCIISTKQIKIHKSITESLTDNFPQ